MGNSASLDHLFLNKTNYIIFYKTYLQTGKFLTRKCFFKHCHSILLSQCFVLCINQFHQSITFDKVELASIPFFKSYEKLFMLISYQRFDRYPIFISFIWPLWCFYVYKTYKKLVIIAKCCRRSGVRPFYIRLYINKVLLFWTLTA